MKSMNLIVGLGNPETQYAQTRHNAGFMCLDVLAKKYEFPEFKLEKKFFGETSCGQIENEKVILLKPHTWMNLSGKSIGSVVNFYKIGLKNISTIFDDADLEFGTTRIREKGRSGGHNGIKSAISALGSEDFLRVKIGISNERRKKIPAEDFVLQKFTSEEQSQLPRIFDEAIMKLSEKIFSIKEI